MNFITLQSETPPPITAVVSFVHGHGGSWKGTATELLDALKSGGYGGFGTFANFIPQTLSRKLNQSSGDLRALGVRVDFTHSHAGSQIMMYEGDGISENVTEFKNIVT